MQLITDERKQAMENTFLPLLFRMKYINRWSLMYNTQIEDLMQHSMECAFITHYLAVIGNRYYGKKYDIDKMTVCAMFHDTTEVLTGDLPTPVKYFNNDIRNVYKKIEKAASEKLLGHIPEDLRMDFEPYLTESRLLEDERKLVKVSDKLCAYIKCIKELDAGNKEFQRAYMQIRNELENIDSDELRYFLDYCMPAFSLSLDDLKGML